jgi:gas vesicle protein
MTFQEKIQDAVNTLVAEAKSNVETTKEQVTSTYNEVVAAAKEEIELQKTAVSTYKERIQALVSKDFNKDVIVEDVKGEVAFFGNEFKSTLNRNVERFKNIFAPKAEEVKETVKKATKKATKKAAAAEETTATTTETAE